MFTSCDEVIDIDVPDNTEKIVVEGQITTEVDSSFMFFSSKRISSWSGCSNFS